MSFINDLKDLKSKNLPVSIFTEKYNEENFSCGFIADIDDDFFYLNHISPNGTEDGVIARRIEDIYRIEFEGEYEKRLEKLYSLKKQDHKKYKAINREEKTKDVLESYLEFAKNNNLIITFASGNEENFSEFTGNIVKFEIEEIHLRQVSFYGEIMGNILFKRADIIKFDYDTLDEKDIFLLLQENSAPNL